MRGRLLARQAHVAFAFAATCMWVCNGHDEESLGSSGDVCLFVLNNSGYSFENT